MYSLVWTDYFSRKTGKFLKKHPEIVEKFQDTILLIEKDPFDNSLRTHKLKGRLAEFYAVSVSRSYRIVLDIQIMEKNVILLNIGIHDDVY